MDLTSRADSVSVRPAAATDQDGIDTVLREAFGGEGPAIVDVVAALRARRLVRHELVAGQDSVVAGYVALSRAWLDARPRLVDVLVLSPLAVDPRHQGRGVGSTLLAAARQEAESSGAPLVFLEGDPGYYRERGFSPARPLGFVPPTVRIPGDAFQVAVLPPHEDWMTGALVYPDVWWERDLAGLRDPMLAELEARGQA